MRKSIILSCFVKLFNTLTTVCQTRFHSADSLACPRRHLRTTWASSAGLSHAESYIHIYMKICHKLCIHKEGKLMCRPVRLHNTKLFGLAPVMSQMYVLYGIKARVYYGSDSDAGAKDLGVNVWEHLTCEPASVAPQLSSGSCPCTGLATTLPD